MSDKEKVLVERIEENMRLNKMELEMLSHPSFDQCKWSVEEVREMIKDFDMMLRSLKELIIWSDEKEI